MSPRLVLVGCIALAGCGRPTPARRPPLDILGMLAASDSGYRRAIEPRSFAFPADHGPHPGYRNEWWYFTGNLTSHDGRTFGFELTFFRSALAPSIPVRISAWAARDAYMAHFAVTDIAADSFVAGERFARAALGLAGARADPLRVWVEDWAMEAMPAVSNAVPTTRGTPPIHLMATQGDAAIDLVLGSLKPPVLEGDHGLSRKGPERGNASYYYSLTRMPAQGTLRTAEGTFEVTGLAWMDREWSTSALSAGDTGWDWFALQLSDGSELMYYRLRRRDGRESPYSAGSLIAPDGSLTRLGSADVSVRRTGEWRSAASDITYPSGWVVVLPSHRLELRVQPRIRNQELDLSFRYWEGAVSVEGDAAGRTLTGTGYVELTGYGHAH